MEIIKAMIEPMPNIIRPTGKLVMYDIKTPLPEKLDSLANKLIHPKINPITNVSTEARKLFSLSFFPICTMTLANINMKPTNASIKRGVLLTISP